MCLRLPSERLACRSAPFGTLAAAVVRQLLRLERTGAATAAGKQAALIETWVLWALLDLTRELEALDASVKPRTTEEETDRTQTACLLSMLFALLIILRGICLRCAHCEQPGDRLAIAPAPEAPRAPLPLPRPDAHARAAWYHSVPLRLPPEFSFDQFPNLLDTPLAPPSGGKGAGICRCRLTHAILRLHAGGSAP